MVDYIQEINPKDELDNPKTMVLTAEKNNTFTTPFDNEELNYFRAIILHKRNEAEEEMETLQSYLANLIDSDDADSSSNAHHIADVASGEDSIHMYYTLIQRTRNYIKQLDRALERIENGTYGICRATGKPIPKGRLEAVPHTRYGVEAKKKGLDKIRKPRMV